MTLSHAIERFSIYAAATALFMLVGICAPPVAAIMFGG